MLIPIFSTEKENDQMVGPWNCQPSCWLNNKWSINDEMYRQSTNAYSWPVWLIWKKTAQHMWKPRTPPQSGWGSPFFDSSDSFPPPLDRWIIWTQGSTHILSIPHVAAPCSIKPLGFQLDLACYRPNWSLYSAVYRVAFQIRPFTEMQLTRRHIYTKNHHGHFLVKKLLVHQKNPVWVPVLYTRVLLSGHSRDISSGVDPPGSNNSY